MSFEREVDRSLVFKNSQGSSVRGTLHKLSRRSIVFEIYNPYSLVQNSEVLTELEIRRGREVMYRGDAVVTSLVSTGIVVVVSATLFGKWSDLSSIIARVEGVQAEVEQFINDWERVNRLDPAYQVRVAEIRSFLLDLSFWLDQIDIAHDATDAQTPRLPDQSFDAIASPLHPKLTALFHEFEEVSRQLSSASTEPHKLLAQRDLHPLIMASPFFHRVFSKPLGYAGDYEMVNMMLNRARKGPTTYAEIINDWLLSAGPPAAHRNRVLMLEQMLDATVADLAPRQSRINILNIGCGPAREVQRFVSSNPLAARCSLELLDFNRETLEYAERQIKASIPEGTDGPQLNFVLRSVHDLLRQAVEQAPVGEQYDLVYCAGLFDYLSDRVCSRLIRLFHQWTVPGGRVVVTNVHSRNPFRFAMEHLMEWHLVLRDETSMAGLVPEFPDNKVYCDPTGINVFLEIGKPTITHG